MNITESESFKKDFKKLLKSYRTLNEDLEILIRSILVEPLGDGSKHWNKLKNDGFRYIFKIRMACRAAKKGKEFRVIYFFDGENIELEFIEIYFKGNKINEDKKRWNNIWKEKTTEQ